MSYQPHVLRQGYQNARAHPQQTHDSSCVGNCTPRLQPKKVRESVEYAGAGKSEKEPGRSRRRRTDQDVGDAEAEKDGDIFEVVEPSPCRALHLWQLFCGGWTAD